LCRLIPIQHKDNKAGLMFHPNLFRTCLLPATPDITMRLIAALKVEQDLQQGWREEREHLLQADF